MQKKFWNRRNFIILALNTIAGAAIAPFIFFRNDKKKHRTENVYVYEGQVIQKTKHLLSKYDNNEITDIEFLNELEDYFKTIDLVQEFKPWFNEIPDSSFNNRFQLYRNKKKGGHLESLALFFIDSNRSHPPHAHHDLISLQVVLTGQLEIHQYERISKLSSHQLLIKKSGHSILNPGDSFKTTEFNNNAHWFGANDEPTIILNYRFTRLKSKTFEDKGHDIGRYYIDPIANESTKDEIVANLMSEEDAYAKFGTNPIKHYLKPTT